MTELIGDIIGGIGDVVGLFGDDENDAQNAAANAANQGAAAQKKLADISEQQWKYYQKIYQPVEQQFVADARAGVKPDYAGITNLAGIASEDVQDQFDIERGTLERNASRRGIRPDDLGLMAAEREMGIQEAAQKAAAITRATMAEAEQRRQERKYANEQTFARRQTAVNSGKGTAGTAINTLSAAGQGLNSSASALQRIGDAQAARDQARYENAGSGLQDIISAAGSILRGNGGGDVSYNTTPVNGLRMDFSSFG